MTIEIPLGFIEFVCHAIAAWLWCFTGMTSAGSLKWLDSDCRLSLATAFFATVFNIVGAHL